MSTIAPDTLKAIKREWDKGGAEDRVNATTWADKLGVKLDDQGNPIAEPHNDNIAKPALALVPKDDAPRGDPAKAVEWMKAKCERLGTYPVATAIYVDPITGEQGKIEKRAFKPDASGATDWAAVYRWLEERQGKANIYWSVNPCIPSADGKIKVKMTEVDAMTEAHADLDFHVNEDPEEGLARLLKKVEAYRHPPTEIIASGNGLGVFWEGKQRLPVQGTTDEEREASARDLASINRAFERDLDGDHCSNLDRLMRWPHTVNIPNKAKRAKGRVLVVSYVIKSDPTCSYDLNTFERMPDPNAPAKSATADSPRVEGRGTKVGTPKGQPASTGPEAPVTDIEDPRLKKFSEHTKRLMVHGRDADNPGDDKSDSGPLFGFLQGTVRAGASDPLMDVIVNDKRWKISAHILKQSNPRAAAARQIAHARKAVAQHDDDEKAFKAACIAELNLENFVIDNKGVIGTFDRVTDRNGHTREHLLMRSPSKFAVAHPQPMFKCEWSSRPRPLGEVWARDENRIHYRDVTCNPNEPRVTADGRLNLWRGFGVEPKEGDWHLMRWHIENVLANGDPKAITYILNWDAWAIQNPGTVAGVALGFRGRQGCGKGVHNRAIKTVFGQHGFQTSKMDQVLGRFNAALEDCSLLYLNEAHVPRDPDKLGAFKGLITEPEISIEHKGVDISFEWPNNLHIIMDGNDDHLAPVAGDDRRFSFFDVPDMFADEADPDSARLKYFNALYHEQQNGSVAAMLYDLRQRDLGDWRPFPAYRNAAHRQQKALSLQGADLIAERILQDQVLPGANAERSNWCRSHGGGSILRDRGARDAGIMDEAFRRACNVHTPLSDKALSLVLRRYGGTPAQNGGGTVRGWEFESPAQCRQRWERHHGGSWDWETETRDTWGVDHDPLPF